MKKVIYNELIKSYVGTMDSTKSGQEKRQRIVSRFRPGTRGHQLYTMSMHEGPWSEAATNNRERLKMLQREAHAIEHAYKHPDQASPELLALAATWQARYAEYKSTKKPADKQYGSLYTYTYAQLCQEVKVGEVLDRIRTAARAKEALYQTVIPQIQSLVAGETDLIANMSNIVAVLHSTFRFWWTGFYLVKDKTSSSRPSEVDQELVLGPFQGPVACTRIPYNRGVCGTAWAQNRTLVVPNVHEFPGHIACSSESKSEIVVPIRHNGEIIAVLDIDSADYNTFDQIDRKYLEQIIVI